MTFKPGQSGNPAGRKPGPSKLGKIRQGLEAAIPEILAALVDAAKNGDPVSAKLILDRCLPALKPEIRPSAAMPVDPDAILAVTASGEIGLDAATALMALVGQRIKIAEGEELIARIEVLEALIQKN